MPSRGLGEGGVINIFPVKPFETVIVAMLRNMWIHNSFPFAN